MSPAIPIVAHGVGPNNSNCEVTEQLIIDYLAAGGGVSLNESLGGERELSTSRGGRFRPVGVLRGRVVGEVPLLGVAGERLLLEGLGLARARPAAAPRRPAPLHRHRRERLGAALRRGGPLAADQLLRLLVLVGGARRRARRPAPADAATAALARALQDRLLLVRAGAAEALCFRAKRTSDTSFIIRRPLSNPATTRGTSHDENLERVCLNINRFSRPRPGAGLRSFIRAFREKLLAGHQAFIVRGSAVSIGYSVRRGSRDGSRHSNLTGRERCDDPRSNGRVGWGV